LGVAVVGSVLASTYGDKIAGFFAGTPVPAAAVDAARNSVGAIPQVAQQLSANGLGEAAAGLQKVADAAFVDAAHWGVAVAAVATAVGMVQALIFLPARARAEDREEQIEEYAEEHTGEFSVPVESTPALEGHGPLGAPGAVVPEPEY